MTKKSVNSKPRKPEYETKAMQETDSLIGSGRGWDTSKEDAEKESKDWVKEQEKTNTLREMWVIGWIVPALMIFVCFLFVVFLGSWAWHFVASECWQWLEDAQIDKIESTIFSGSLGAVASIYFQGKIKKKSTVSDTTSQFE